LIKHTALVFCILSFATPTGIMAQGAAQSFESSSLQPSLLEPIADLGAADGGGGQVMASPMRGASGAMGPLSHFAIGGGISTMGVNLQAATNLNRYMNLRATRQLLQLHGEQHHDERVHGRREIELRVGRRVGGFLSFPQPRISHKPGGASSTTRTRPMRRLRWREGRASA
jgi:hypothetical protein